MIREWFGVPLVLTAFAVLTFGIKALQTRYQIHPELARKAMHVGMGLVCLPLPWLFRSVWPVWVLALLAVAGLCAMKTLPALRSRFGAVLGGVERASLGEVYFPIAVALTFAIAEGDRLLFVIPILVLTLADTTAALIGIRYGLVRYQTDEGEKSVEGSLAFFTVAFMSAHVPLLLFTQTDRTATLLISLTIGLLIMLLEAISWRGLDNLIVPVGVALLLKWYLFLPPSALLARFVAITLLTAFALCFRRRTTLSDSAVIGAGLAGYAMWALGGWPWLIGPLLLFVVALWLPRPGADDRPARNLHAVTRVMAGAFLWLLASKIFHRTDFVIPCHICLGCHAANLIFARVHVADPARGKSRVTAMAGALACALFLPLLWVIDASLPLVKTAVVGIACLVTSAVVFARFWPAGRQCSQEPLARCCEAAIAFVASIPAMILLNSPMAGSIT